MPALRKETKAIILLCILAITLSCASTYISLIHPIALMNENQILYIFSTSAQVVAGIFGLTISGFIFLRSELDRQQRIRDGVLKQINQNPELKRAYDLLVKNVPEDEKEGVIAQIGRTARRAVARVQGQQQTRGEAVGV